MTIQSSINKIGNWINNNQRNIIIGLVIFIFLVKQGIIPSTFSIQTMSIFGGGIATIGTGILLIAIGLGLFLLPGGAIFMPIFFTAGALLISGGAVVLAIIEFFKTTIGLVVAGFLLLLVYLRYKR